MIDKLDVKQNPWQCRVPARAVAFENWPAVPNVARSETGLLTTGLLKKLIPASVKDIAKSTLNAGLGLAGWKLAPQSSIVLEPDNDIQDAWYASPVDGMYSKHRSPSLDDKHFQATLAHLHSHQAFPGLESATRGETVLSRLYLAYQLAHVSRSIPGELVEFGTYRGATAYCMLAASESPRRDHQGKSIHLFDTFSGIPERGMTEHERQVGLLGAHADTSVASVKRLMDGFADRVVLHPGWIPETLTTDRPDRIAMMHVDLNLAEPTLQALRWAYPRWSPGGICLLDDYLWAGFEDQRGVVESFFRSKGLPIVGLPTGQGIVWNLASVDSPSD